MATLKIELGKPKQNGNRKVMIVISQHGARKRIPTSIEVEPVEVVKTKNGAFKIKSPRKQHILDDAIKAYKDKIYELETEMTGEYIGIDDIFNHLTGQRNLNGIDFFAFAEKWISHSPVKGIKNYSTTLNALEDFLNRRILPFSEIDYDFLKRFERHLQGKPRAQSLYLGHIRHLYREAMLELNNEKKTVIKSDPFLRFKVMRQQMRKGVRALTLEQLMKIHSYNGVSGSRDALARDCFILSFCLMGMNSVDMYELKNARNGAIRYSRAKTKDRRSDGAYIEVNIHPFIVPLMKKYKGSSRVFNFSDRYSSAPTFNQNLNKGLKKIGKAVGIDNLQFYQARHTFATLSRNLMRFSKSDVDEALNHIGTMDIADVYIAKDFSIINDNNYKLIERVFGDYIIPSR